MHAKGFLHKILGNATHKKRFDTLALLVSSVLTSKKLSVTELGRGLELSVQERSCIRRVDRFLSNESFYKEKPNILALLIKQIIGEKKQLDIIVDWTECPNTTHHIIRAALASKGRAITLYEEVHPQKKLENREVHKNFLQTLKSFIPANCKVLIITDGGFHNPWFRDVLSCGWDYLGRIRVGSGKKFTLDKKIWWSCGELCEKANKTPRFEAKVSLCKKSPLETNLYLYKGEIAKRKTLNKFGRKRSKCNDLDYRKMAHEPWILATSLSGSSYLSAKRAVNKYQKRMQIEEGIRDLKSSRYGFSFENAHSYKIVRIEVLLLIAALAAYIAFLIGWVGELLKLHLNFQTNSIKNRRVLSLFFLGCQMVRRKIPISSDIIQKALMESHSR